MLKSKSYTFANVKAIRVTPNGKRFLTIDKSRVKAFQDAVSLGYKQFTTIPAMIVSSLEKEIRRIRLFTIEQVRQGFICNDWEEAEALSMYLGGIERIKAILEEEYKWIRDYLS